MSELGNDIHLLFCQGLDLVLEILLLDIAVMELANLAVDVFIPSRDRVFEILKLLAVLFTVLLELLLLIFHALEFGVLL